jgi:DNA polymerase (family 10)
MENADMARIFSEIADLMEIKGANPFRIRSFRMAALNIENSVLNLETLVKGEKEKLQEIPGIGKGIAGRIVEIVERGDCEDHRKLLDEVPGSLLDLLQIEGVGPKKVKLFHEELGVKTVDDLEREAMAKRLRDLPKMGARSEEKLLKAISDYRGRVGRFLLRDAMEVIASYTQYLGELDGVLKIEPAGSFRRRRDTVGDLDILVTCRKGTPVMDHFIGYGDLAEVVAHGETKSSVKLRSKLQVDLRVLEPESFGAALHYFTGSKAHNIAVRDRGVRMGLKINEYGVFKKDTEERIGGLEESDVFEAVGLVFIPPELREGRGEIEAAERGEIPKLVEIEDIRGDLHAHTKFTDGANTIREMAVAAMAKGYEYLAITDHSKHVSVAGGIDEKTLLREIEDVAAVNRDLDGIRLLSGIEVDILPDGSLDLDTEVLRRCDCVVASVHYRFEMPKEEMTARIIRAMESGVVHVIAHPTGRILTRREPYLVDMERIMKEAAKLGVALELNAYPDRLDLNDVHCRMAREFGVPVAVSTDSHHTSHLENMRFGIFTARRGWLEAKHVVNTRPLDELMRFLRRR